LYDEKKTNLELLASLRCFLLVEILPDHNKQNPGDFTRNRKLPFTFLVTLMLKALRKKIALEIHYFYDRLVELTLKEESINLTASAFCQSRQKLRPEFFRDGLHHLCREFYTENELNVKLWQGKRLLAIDGSIIELPHTAELEQQYGTYANQHKTLRVQARISLLYDVLNDLVLDGQLGRYKDGERVLAESHLAVLSPGDLVIYDRGYPSFDFIFQHHQGGIDFVMRAKVTWNNAVCDFVRSGVSSQLVDLTIGKNECVKHKPYDHHTPITVRMVRVELSTGEIEILISSLLDDELYPTAIFKNLYQQRWGVETRFDMLKNALHIEHFSGVSQRVIMQDFYITLLVSNLEALLREEVNQQIQQKYNHRQHHYQVNITVSVSLLREKIVDLLLGKNPQQTLAYLAKVFAQNIEPVRTNRSFPRKADQYRTKNKPKQFRNRRSNL